MVVKILTGDNDLISRKVCRDVGLIADPMLLGDDVEKMSDTELAEAAEKTTLFARLSPAHKQRIVRVLRGKGHVVGFLGDGINDSPALRAADIGISVDTAADIAKESADLILLQKDLMVLEGGVIEGRKVFANIIKYIRMGASSNFGNMFSVLGASAFLPFLPMAPIQILPNNMLYDFSQVPIPNDAVDWSRGPGPGILVRSSDSFFVSGRSARSSTTPPSSSCFIYSSAGIQPALRCFRQAGSLSPS